MMTTDEEIQLADEIGYMLADDCDIDFIAKTLQHSPDEIRRLIKHREEMARNTEDADKLKQVEDVLKAWNVSTHKWRSSHAIVRINAIFAPAPKET